MFFGRISKAICVRVFNGVADPALQVVVGYRIRYTTHNHLKVKMVTLSRRRRSLSEQARVLMDYYYFAHWIVCYCCINIPNSMVD